ncbi:MAG: type IV-A pilus assembly ATPase PilB [Bdellovibrionales bacterium]|nr:type IV-A pilus assembly ATPase PilB [Bdellovibrionales bacterium]
MSRTLVDLLLKDKLITAAQHAESVEAAKTGKSHARYLIEKKYVADQKLLYYLSQKFKMTSINLAKLEVTPEVLKLLPPDFVKKSGVIPVQANKTTLVVAVADPSNAQVIEDIKFRTKLNVETVLTTFGALDQALAKFYSGAAFAVAAAQSYQDKAKKEGEDSAGSGIELVEIHDIDTGAGASDAPVIALVNGILAEGIKRMASDIHVEPYEKRFRVRLRVDGTLHEIMQIPQEMKRAVAARFKIMSRMDIAESRIPQDGRIKLKTGGNEVDFRVNALPTLFGEKIVLRMLSKGNLQLDLMKLGFEAKQLETFKKGIYAPNGMVLVTGPTGSGKTTTLYSALSELNQPTDNLSTAEDPVEYNLEGINQCQVNKDVGLTFAAVLRALLRQDPDTVLVGEIRDFETAEVAVQAALTGHLVLSTLHTNDAPSTITRLMNMGLEPFLVVASVNTIVAQRLLRTVCAKCKVETQIPKERLLEVGFTPEQIPQIKAMKGAGCEVCAKSGYKGRVAIYEVLDFSQDLKEMVLRGESIIDIKKQAIKNGMKSLRMAALTKFAEGRTTIDEALSLTMEN